MGKLKIEGKATREYVCDMCEITITLCAREVSSSEAIKKNLTQCEKFLKELSEYGIGPENVRMDKEVIDHATYNDDRDIKASRNIMIRFSLDMKVITAIESILAKEEYNVTINISYGISNIAKIHDELIKEAVLDSKNKAELIAESQNQQVICIDSMHTGRDYGGRLDGDCMNSKFGSAFGKNTDEYELSAKMGKPTIEKEAVVTVVWKIK